MIYYKGRQIDEINAYNVEGTTLNNQTKEIEIDKNGETIITYDEGYTGLEQVTVNVNVASQGGEGGNSFSVIGYESAPQYIQDGIDYGQTIYDNWDASITNRSNAFKNDKQLLYFPLVDTSNVTNMSGIFSGCTNLQYVPSFDTSNVTNMNEMFYQCSGLTSLNVSNFNASNVTSMGSIFYGCKSLTSLDLSNFNTPKVTSMSQMFNYCSGLTSINFGDTFNTSKVTNMQNMFGYCSGLTSLDLSSFDTSNVTSMGYMFYNCSGLTELDLSNFNTPKVTSMDGMFNGCSDLTSLDISSWDTSNVTNMSWMFAGCSGLTSLDISSWDTSNVNNMSYMFYGCTKLQRIDGYFDWSKITTFPTNFIYHYSTMLIRYFTIKNLGAAGTLFNFNNNSLQNWGDETDTETYPLSVGARQSLVDSLLTYSYDRAANGLSNATIQLNSKVKARLTADEITAIQNKGYIIS